MCPEIGTFDAVKDEMEGQSYVWKFDILPVVLTKDSLMLLDKWELELHFIIIEESDIQIVDSDADVPNIWNDLRIAGDWPLRPNDWPQRVTLELPVATKFVSLKLEIDALSNENKLDVEPRWISHDTIKLSFVGSPAPCFNINDDSDNQLDEIPDECPVEAVGV